MPSLFPARLAALRAQSGLSQEKFAALLNLSKSALANYEAGTREPNYETLIKIADLLGVTLDHLLGRTNAHPERPFEVPYKELLKGLKDDQYTLGGRPIPTLQKLMIQIPLESIQKIIKALLDHEAEKQAT